MVSMETIFWALFGMDDADSTSLEGFQADFTQAVGMLLFGVYNWIMVVVLLNMLIALMSQSLDTITVCIIEPLLIVILCLFSFINVAVL